jgi:undecaprenyl-diphosphatase
MVLAGVAVVLIALPFSFLLWQVLDDGSITRFDGDVADELNEEVHDRVWLTVPLEGITWLGRFPVLALACLLTATYTARRHLHRLTLFVVVTCAGGQLVNSLVEILVDRPRPVVDHPIITAYGKSFPSGHAMVSTVVLGAVLLTFLPAIGPSRRRLAVAATCLLALLIGASRVLLGVHFVSDVVAGHVLGIAWLAASVAVFEIWRVERGRPVSDVVDEGLEPEAGPALREPERR